MPILRNYRSLETEASPYICPLCGYLMKDPVQTSRGHLACEDCYCPALAINNGISPIDSESISRSEIFRDKAREKEILNLKCHCIYKDKGCQWNGTIRALNEHDCEYEAVRGPMCDEKGMQNELFKHQTCECQSLSKAQKCRYNAVGCSFEANAQEEMADHMIRSKSMHKILETCQNLRLENELIKKENQNLHKKIHKFKGTFLNVVEQTALQVEVTKLAEQLYKKMRLSIMLTKFDNILEWPLTKKVKFTIVPFVAPNHLSSFQKPRKSRNIAKGCPLVERRLIDLNKKVLSK